MVLEYCNADTVDRVLTSSTVGQDSDDLITEEPPDVLWLVPGTAVFPFQLLESSKLGGLRSGSGRKGSCRLHSLNIVRLMVNRVVARVD